jgi:hypothetical protein
VRPIDLRGLFDNLRVPWRDRGANTSRGNVNICCPFCRDDYGYHMTISETREGAYYCYRRPQEHSGGNLVRVLVKLGASRTEAISLINNFAGSRATEHAGPEIVASSEMQKRWDGFRGIADGPDRYLDYLEYERLFVDPERVARTYDLRYARLGRWAGRVLFPMHDADGGLGGWTGRAVSKDAELRYLTEHGNRDGAIYVPRAGRYTMFIMEGPMDALKGAVATEDLPISTLALTGKQLNPARLANVAAACARSAVVLMTLDADTTVGERSRMLAELRGACRHAEVRMVRGPSETKDVGAMTEDQARRWMQGLAS